MSEMLIRKDNWIEREIKKILSDSYAGGTPNRSRDDYFGGNIPWISSGEINSGIITSTKEYITELGLENSSARWIPSNAVLVAMYGATAGQVAKLKIKATSNQAVLALIPSKDLMDRDFLYHSLKFQKNNILYLAQGSGQPNLSKNLVERFKLSYPEDIKIQKYIAKILDSCDKVIEETEAGIAKYKAIKQGMLHDLFTRGLDKNGKLRPTPSEAPDLYKESELGLIPKDWDISLFGHNSITYAGGTPSRSNEDYFKGDIPWVSSSEVNQDEIKKAKEYITKEALDNSSAKKVQKGSVLIALYGATAGQVSKLLIDATTNQAVLACLESDSLISEYIYYLLCNFKNNILYKAQGSGQPNLSKEIVDKTKIFLPRIEEQKSIVKLLSSIDLKIITEKDVSNKYKSVKKGLMKRLLHSK